MDPAALVQARLAEGDHPAAATAAIEGFAPAILGYLSTILGDDDDAQDVLSMWAEDVWRGLPAFRGECSVRAWLYAVAWHAVCRFRRDPYRRRAERLPSSAASRLAASVAGSALAPGSRRDRLRRLREQLAPEDQTLLVLRVDRELEWDEIAAVLSADGAPVTSAALRKRFERLKDRLAELARSEGLVDD